MKNGSLGVTAGQALRFKAGTHLEGKGTRARPSEKYSTVGQCEWYQGTGRDARTRDKVQGRQLVQGSTLSW